MFFLFSLSRKVGALTLHARCINGTFSLHYRCVGVATLSPTARCADGALFLHGRCVGGVLRAKNRALRPFSKMDEVEVYPYHLGEVEFSSLTYGEDPLDPSY